MWPFKRKEEPFPLEERIFLAANLSDAVSDKMERTPDYLWLERHEWRLLFVYDEMMHSRRLYHLIGEDSINLGKVFTETEDWSVYKKLLGEETFPIAFKSNIGVPRRVKGELHAVRPHLFWNCLDKRFLNGTEFKRERVKVLFPYRVIVPGGVAHGEEFIQRVSAFMYIGVPEYWEPQIDNGFEFKAVSAFNPKVRWIDGKEMNTYYYYSRLEDETNF